MLARARVLRTDRLGAEGRVLRAFLGGEEGGEGRGVRLKSMLFRAHDNPVADLLATPGAPPLHLAGHLRAETWQGNESVCFAIEDAVPA